MNQAQEDVLEQQEQTSERVCALPGCGKSLAWKSAKAKYCCDAHRIKAADARPERKAKRIAKAQTQESKLRARARARQQARRQTQESKMARKVECRSPEYKEKQRNNHARKANKRVYSKTPKCKARRKAYNRKPERVAKNRELWRAKHKKRKEAKRLAKEEAVVTGITEAVRDGLRRPDLLPLFCTGIDELLLVEHTVEANRSRQGKQGDG